MEVRIEPLDTLFFRDGKPFSMGEETWADGYLLPPPSVIYGALRTAIATQNGIAFEEVEKKLSTDVFSIGGIYYYITENMLPMPLDLVEYKSNKATNSKKKKWKVNLLKFADEPHQIVHTDKQISFKSYLIPERQAENIDDGLLSIADLEEYLCNNLDYATVDRLSNCRSSEPKVGIGRDDNTRTVDEGLLYRVDMNRYQKSIEKKPLRIGVCFNCAMNFNPYIRLGGEMKLVHLNPTEDESFKIKTHDVEFQEGLFKIYLATPAIFWNGLPDLFLKRKGINAGLIAACIGKPLNLGGFDLKSGKPKPMYKAVPAGSVFYYKSEDDLSLLHQEQGVALSDVYPEQGFGIAYFGAYSTNKP